MTPEETAFKESVERLYQVFAKYPLREDTGMCPCCHDPEDRKRLHAKPLRELSPEDLEPYTWSALLTWGDVEDFKHFLPRLFETISDCEAEVEVLLEKLNPILNLYDSSKGIPEAAGAITLTPLASGSDKTTILAIDDKANILDLLKEFLGEQFNVITADCGKTALHAIAHNRFDYMFLDLSMPDMNAFEILDYYLKNNPSGAGVKRVVAMTLRTAQADIERAAGAGVGAFLYKPLNNDDIAALLNNLAAKQKDAERMSGHFLTSKGKVRILECPPEKSSRFKTVAGALTSEVVREIDEMAEEGLNQLVIKVGEGFLSDLGTTRKFVDMVEHTVRLSVNVRLVADSEQARAALKQFAETASIPTDTSLEFALSSIG